MSQDRYCILYMKVEHVHCSVKIALSVWAFQVPSCYCKMTWWDVLSCHTLYLPNFLPNPPTFNPIHHPFLSLHFSLCPEGQLCEPHRGERGLSDTNVPRPPYRHFEPLRLGGRWVPVIINYVYIMFMYTLSTAFVAVFCHFSERACVLLYLNIAYLHSPDYAYCVHIKLFNSFLHSMHLILYLY